MRRLLVGALVIASCRSSAPTALPKRDVVEISPNSGAVSARLLATASTRLLFVAFTIRRKLIRPIPAREMIAKERRAYAFYSKEDSEVQ